MSRMIVLAAIIGFATVRGATQDVPRADRSKPPSVVEAPDGFTVRRLSGPVPIDGHTWIAIETANAAGRVRAPNARFTLTLEEAKDHAGDVVRFRIFFTEGGGARVQLHPGVAAYAYITPDSRWIVSDPLDVVDVRNWRKYSLSKSFNIASYIIPRAISADGRRLFISRQACPFDCQNIPHEYFEIGFP